MTLDDLAKVEGQAELINGEIVHFPLHGFRTGQIIAEIVFQIRDFTGIQHRGTIFTSTLGYVLPKPLNSGRQSFCADASFYFGPRPENRMGFVIGAPDFAVEVRDEEMSTLLAMQKRTAKRADYFAAGTLVVWDVDPDARTIVSYRSTDPSTPNIFPAGSVADAEPALPGWRVAVDCLFV